MEHKNILEFDEPQEDGIAEGWRKQDRHLEEAENEEAMDALSQKGGGKDEMLDGGKEATIMSWWNATADWTSRTNSGALSLDEKI